MVDSVRQTNNKRDIRVYVFASKAVITIGIALNTNGQCEELLPTPALQKIINKRRGEFENAIDDQF